MPMLRRLFVALALVLSLLASAAAAAESYTSSQAVREKGLDALIARIGQNRPIVRLSFSGDTIDAVAQADAGSGFARWTVNRLDLGIANFHFASGPTGAFEGVVDDPSGAYFRLSEIDLGKFDAVEAAAITHAKLEDPPETASVEIGRAVSILPEATYGEIRWTVALRTDDEHATVYLTREGEVLGADLSDTKRADNLNLWTSDDWPMDEAQAALAGVLGRSPVHTVRLYENYIFVTAQHPTDPELARDYSWRLGGITHGLVDTPNLVSMGMSDNAPFRFDEVDPTALPDIKAAAREAFGSTDAMITGIEASKPTDRPMGELKVLWEIEFRETSGETGAVWLDATGNVVEVKLPESRLPELGPWLAPATVVDTLRRIGEAFGPNAKISEILINDTQASIDIEDPQAPGEVAHFLMDAREVSRFGTGSFFASLDPSNVFTPSDLGGLTAAQLEDMVRRTEERLALEGGAVFRFTFSRHALIMNPGDNRLMVEIRYGQNDGRGDSGWMTFLLDGTQTDEMMP